MVFRVVDRREVGKIGMLSKSTTAKASDRKWMSGSAPGRSHQPGSRAKDSDQTSNAHSSACKEDWRRQSFRELKRNKYDLSGRLERPRGLSKPSGGSPL